MGGGDRDMNILAGLLIGGFAAKGLLTGLYLRSV